MMNHVMVDLETLGTSPDTAFISIGAVKFDPNTGEMDTNTFYKRIDWESATKSRSIKASTILWWFQQSEAARLEVCKQGEPLTDVLSSFRAWFPEDGVIWGNGSTFDVSILQHAYDENPPWKFWAVHDVRTVVALCEGKIDRSQFVFDGEKHNALHDAIYQAKYVSAMWQAIKYGLSK